MVAQNRPAMQETRIQYLGWEDLLEEGMATHSSILAWKTPWTEEPGGLHHVLIGKDTGSIPGQGTKIPQATLCSQHK